MPLLGSEHSRGMTLEEVRSEKKVEKVKHRQAIYEKIGTRGNMDERKRDHTKVGLSDLICIQFWYYPSHVMKSRYTTDIETPAIYNLAIGIHGILQ